MLQYAVVADDLTGAGDTGVQFALAGLRTRLLLSDQPAEDGADVAACHTDSRALSANAAYERVRSKVELVRALGAREVYKKIDSTLRGNLGAELDAVLDAMPHAFALVCPALPAQGRTVVDGHLLVNGEPVTRTAIARDPATPVTDSYIPALVAQQSRRRVGRTDLSVLAGGPERAAATLDGLLATGAEVVIADAVSREDLDRLVDATRSLRRPAVLVGSAGLARPLAAHWASALARPLADHWAAALGAGQERVGRALPGGAPAGAKVLAVVGSVHPSARAQLSVLIEQGMVPFKLDLAAALADDRRWGLWLAGLADDLQQPMRAAAPGVVITTDGTPEDVARARRLALEGGRDPAGVPRLLAGRLAEMARAALAAAPVAGLVLTGGDTAVTVLQGLGAAGLDLIGEVGPGIAVGLVAGGSVDGVPVVTKAGGFGGRDALWQAVEYLAERGRLPA